MRRFPLTLLPLRPGHLILPSVVIRPVVGGSEAPSTRSASASDPATTPSSTTTNPAAPVLRCETHYRSQAQTIMVLPDVISTTVALESGRAGSTATLVDTTAAKNASTSTSTDDGHGGSRSTWLRS